MRVVPLPTAPPTLQGPADGRGRGQEQGLAQPLWSWGEGEWAKPPPLCSGHRWFHPRCLFRRKNKPARGQLSFSTSCLFSRPLPLPEASVLGSALCRGSGWRGHGIFLTLGQLSG